MGWGVGTVGGGRQGGRTILVQGGIFFLIISSAFSFCLLATPSSSQSFFAFITYDGN